MRITVKEALSIYPLSEARLVAGEKGASQIIKSLNIMDAPDIADWIKPGELLFTTAYLLKDNPDDVIPLMRKLKNRGCVGLGIKLGRFWNHIPQHIIDEADRIGFPLLILPYQFTFSDQMNALFHAERERSTKILQNVLKKQEKLMQCALRHRGIGELFQAVGESLGYPIAFVGEGGHLFFNTSSWPKEVLVAGMPWENGNRWIRSSHGAAYRIALMGNDDRCCGYFFVMPDETLPPKAEEGLFHQAAELLAHHLGQSYEEYVRSTMQHELGALLIRYLQGKIPVEMLLEQAEKKGLPFIAGPYQCVLAAAGESRGSEAHWGMRIIRQELHFHSYLRKYKAWHFDLPEGIFSIYSLKAEKRLEEELAKHLTSGMKEADAGRADAPRFYISRMKRKPESLMEAYRECLEARALSLRFRLNDTVIPFETVEFASIFQHIPLAVMQAYCDRVLHALTVKGEGYARDMLETLESYIQNDGQIRKVAKSLHIHRNTVTYRLEKAGEILKMDLDRLNDMMKLKIAFLFRNFIEKSSST